MIQIKPNDYVQPTEVREEVVQGICDAFLADNCWHTFHPFDGSNRGCRNAQRYIIKHKNDTKFYGFKDKPFQGEDGTRFNGAEMKRAFDELINAGYYMFKVYTYGSWMGYRCHNKPYLEGGTRVESFNDFID